MRRSIWLIAMAACGGGAAETARPEPLPQSAAQKTYSIQLHRDAHVGARAHVVFEGEDDSTITTTTGGESKPQHEIRRVRFDAVSTVTAVDDHHDATQTHYDVADLSLNGTSLYHGPLDVTKASKPADAKLLVDGKPAEGPVYKALKDVLPLTVNSATDDEIFGTRVPQAVGAHWPVNAAAALADLAKDQDLSAGSVTGESTLVAVTQCCLDVRANVHVSDLSVAKSPGNVEGTLDATFQALFPLDTTRSRTEEHETARIHMKVTMDKSAGGIVVTMDGNLKTNRWFTDLPRSP